MNGAGYSIPQSKVNFPNQHVKAVKQEITLFAITTTLRKKIIPIKKINFKGFWQQSK
ncbi:MAG: hypothetical protein L6428_00830 [Candidatus Aminicenantes bacterium]|nr:hypothetical protein [Acidobacteriota bacterium]MCG2809987.1 hypothetical protein [Candidatus Aminicenantes bacterium]